MAPLLYLQTQAFFQKIPVIFNTTANSLQLHCGWMKKVIKRTFAGECKSECYGGGILYVSSSNCDS